MHKNKILIFLFGIVTVANAQITNTNSSVNLPAIMPASPEAASLIKAGQLSVGLFTGAINTGIPVYTIQNKDISYPIGLAYTSNGFRTDEIPSRVGMGWSLQAGGVISRQVYGIPDEDRVAIPVAEPSDLTANNAAVFSYLNYAANMEGNYETQPDEYRFSVEGVNGRFIIQNNQVIQIPYSKLIIKKFGASSQPATKFEITDTKGITYTFDTHETAQTISLSGKYKNKQNIRTAWYLSKISSLEGAEINFSYSNINTISDPGFTITAKQSNGMSCGNANNYSWAYCASEFNNIKVNKVTYNTVYLTSINSNNGTTITLSYENRPDASGEVRLKNISISKTGGLPKLYTLDYADKPISISTNEWNYGQVKSQRFFLQKFSEVDPNGELPPNETNFEYNSLDDLPPRLTIAQDFYGFYNGSGSSGTAFVPNEPPYQGQWNSVGYHDRKPNWESAQKGILKKIVFPTGGTEEIEYESNGQQNWYNNTTIERGGIRVKDIKKYDPVTNKSIFSYYEYGAAPPPLAPPTVLNYPVVKDCPGEGPLTCNSPVFSESTLGPVNFGSPWQVQYYTVKEYNDPAKSNGYVQHEFDLGTVYTGSVIRGNTIHYTPFGAFPNTSGEEIATKVYNAQNQLLKESNTYFGFDTRGEQNAMIKLVRKRQDPVYTNDCEIFDVSSYLFNSKWIHVDSVVSKEYEPNYSTAPMVTKQTFFYENADIIKPTAIETTNTINEVIRKEMKYPVDFAANGNVYAEMVQQNNLLPVIEEKTLKAGVQLSRSRNNLQLLNGVAKPDNLEVQKANSTTETRMRYYAYDVFNNPLELSKENDIRISYIWDYNHELPIAEASNTHWYDIAYTSFESTGTGNWSVTGNAEETGFTGNWAYGLKTGDILNLQLRFNSGLDYIVQYWQKDDGGKSTVNSENPDIIFTKNGWSLMQIKLINPAALVISGDAIIDELRVYPATAQIKTMTYIPGTGLLTINDDRANLLFYEYDSYGRLKRIRDIDKNIIKQMEYKYGQNIEPCANTASNWVATGVFRCVKDSVTNNNTGVQEKQERDLNNCSDKYYTTRWVGLGNTGNCPPIVCTGNDKRVVNGICETGVKHVISGVYNHTTHIWTCTFYYTWTDGYNGTTYTTTGTISCYQYLEE
jgi:YD repeat-containing protein